MRRRAFYGYFEHKQSLILAMLEEDAAALNDELERFTQVSGSGIAPVRKFAQAMTKRGEDNARVQVRADLWADLLTEEVVRERLAEVMQRRRVLVCSWIEDGVASGELVEIPEQRGSLDPNRIGKRPDAPSCT